MEEWFQPGSSPDGLERRSVQYADEVPAAVDRAATPAGGGHGRGSAMWRSASMRHASHHASAAARWEPQNREVAAIHERFGLAAAGSAAAAAGLGSGQLLERRFDLAGGQLLLTMAAPEPGGAPVVLQLGKDSRAAVWCVAFHRMCGLFDSTGAPCCRPGR